MDNQAYQHLVTALNNTIEPDNNSTDSYQSLLAKIDDARFVLIGEATHGTHEFYQTRIEITKKLIQEKGFMAVAIEGDWPDAYQLNRYAQAVKNSASLEQAFDTFKRYPVWMWRNTTLPPFIQWLRDFNNQITPEQKIGFYGLDLYSLQSSMHEVIQYLDIVDPVEAKHARARYACFDHVKPDAQEYGYLTSMGIKKSCSPETIEQLIALQHHALDYVKRDGLAANEEAFYAIQNARVVKNAENYYRSMFEGRISTWNIRDRHMHETLNILADHLENKFGKPAKIVVWAHNSHIGDARATEMGEKHEVNLGQLVREQHDQDTYLIGFSTYEGTVTASDDWDTPAKCKHVNPGVEGSYEHLFHHLDHKQFILDLRSNTQLEHYLKLPRLQRAIGVIYRPDTERQSHYFFTHLPYQFDCLIHIDKTSAIKPLTVNPEWQKIK